MEDSFRLGHANRQPLNHQHARRVKRLSGRRLKNTETTMRQCIKEESDNVREKEGRESGRKRFGRREKECASFLQGRCLV